ncbi:MAG: lipopolysaccharide kinase InaA family protein [Candidatus Caldarchaeum sp.]|nr:lipopolysaccharide kinase InaA family protein [Candidatus Caldarchaeum sp.]
MSQAAAVVERLAEEAEAAFSIPAGKTPEIIILLKKLKPVVKVLQADGYRVYLVNTKEFEADVAHASYAETFAHRLLTPYRPLKGEEYLRRLEKAYKKEIITDLCKDLVSEHKLAAANLLIDVRYFLYEKVRRLVEVFPLMRPDLVGSLENAVESVRGFEAAAEELVEEGVLRRRDGYYCLESMAVESFMKTPVLSGLEQLRKINPLKASRALSLIVFEIPTRFLESSAQLPDPDQFIYMQMARGLQPLAKQLGMMEFVKEFYGDVEARIRRVGGLFNSTYVIEVDSAKLFAKRYLSWTDVKWIAARVWTAWVKDFSINPSTRMAKEIYYLNHLRNHGFNTPEIVHVNWRDKILYTSYIEGLSLINAWLSKTEDRRAFARKVGRTLAEIHDKGVRLGDCKPETFIKSVEDAVYVTDVEQASTDGDPAWDLMELVFYSGHYLDADEAAVYAAEVVEGYAEAGSWETVKRMLRPSYVRTMALWTPPWVQKAMADSVKQFLKA